MKRKQFLALLMSASVLSSTVMPAYASETVEHLDSAETVYTEETTEPVQGEEVVPEKENDDTALEENQEDNVEEEVEDIAAEETEVPEDAVVNEEAQAEPTADERAVVVDETLQNSADFKTDAANFVGHYRIVDGSTVDLVYIDTKLVDPGFDVAVEDVTNVSIPATVEYNGQIYNVRDVDCAAEPTFIWETASLTLEEGISSIYINGWKMLNTLTLPSTLTSFNRMSGQLNDGTPSAAVLDSNIGTVNFAGNSELVYDAGLRKFYSTTRGGGACENAGDQFSLYNFKYELVDAGTVDIIGVLESEIDDNVNITVPRAVSFRGKTFNVRNADLRYLNGFNTGACPSMRSLTVENGVQNLYFDSDSYYENVEVINIPASADLATMSEFPNLVSWNLDGANANYASEDGVLFNKAKTELISFPANKSAETYVVPECVDVIKTNAFIHNKGIQTLVIPETVEKMEPMAVRATLNLSNIEINNVAVIEHNNIKECMNLETVTVRGVEEYPFGFISDNPQLKTINIEGNINYFGGTSLSGNLSLEAYNVADSNCYAVDGVLYAGSTLFSYPAAKSGEQFVIQPSVKRIAKGAFDSTKNLQKLICPKGLEFDTQCISYPVNPIDVYLSDLDKIHFVDNKKTGMFMSSVGGHIYAPTQATLDSILAVADTAINGMTAEIGVIPVESVEVKNDSLTIRKGKTADIEYTVSPAYATEQVQFEATGDVCSVTTDGIVTGIKSGTGTVTIKNSNGVLKTINVKVKTPVESMQFASDKYEMDKGDVQKLRLTYKPEDADIEDIDWKSSDEKVLKFNEKGEAVAMGAGTAEVTARCENVTAKCKVTVKVPLESISMSEDKKTINKGSSFDLDITMNPTDATVTTKAAWTSNNEEIATVDQNGKVTAVGAGTTTITAMLEGKETTCRVTVKVPLESISMSETKKTVNKGDSFKLDITKNPTDTTVTGDVKWTSDNKKVATVDKDGNVTAVGAVNKGDSFKLDITKNPTDTTVTGDVKWTSDNKKVATVDKDGNVTAVGAGTATITARLEGKETTCKVTVKVPLESISMSETKKTVNKGDSATITARLEGKETTCKVTVKVPLESISMSETKKTVNKGDSFDLDITKNPTDTTVDAKAAWSSANAGVATVDQNGMVTAVGAGTTVITANLEGKETTCEIVVKVPLESIEMSEKEISLVEDGEAQLNVIYAPTDTTVEKNVAWTSSKPDVAVVDQAGKVTAKTVGTATISAEVDGKTTTCKVTVTKKPVALESIELSEAKITMVETDKKQLTVKYNPSNTTVDRDVAWTTSNNKVAVVAADGTITAKGAGTATITATVAGKNASCVVTVKRKEVALESIELSETNVTMKAGNKKHLNVIYNPANTTVEKNVKWSTTDADVASVDKNGMVTAKSEGTVTITASVDGKNATCEVNVEKADVIDIESIQINEQDVHLTKGDEKQLTVSYSPTNATVDKTVNWSSDNADVVSVDNNGKLVAKGVGVATITAEMSGKTAICKVTVKEVPEIVNPEEESDKNNSVNGEVTGENPETTESSNSSVPKTGDAGSANLLMGMLTSAAAGVSGLLARKRKKATDKDEK